MSKFHDDIALQLLSLLWKCNGNDFKISSGNANCKHGFFFVMIFNFV